jgi:ELWxxDGT repeat protein
LNNVVYFHASESGTGSELWRSDGTGGGTYLVKDIRPGPESSSPYNVTAFKNNLYLSANDGANGYELWRSDGTTSGTFLLKDISTANGDGYYGRPEKFQEVNDQLYFTFEDEVDCWLWKTDGTSSGTMLMKKVDRIHTMMNGTDRLYFLSYSSTNKLWSSQGSPGTTQLVKDLGPNGSVGSHVMIGPVLYMNGNNTTHRSDGSECGTFELDMPLNGAHSESMNYPGIEAINNDLIFGAYRSDIGQELFKMNTADILVPACDEAVAELMALNESVQYPNPFASDFSLEVDGPKGGSFNIQIYDLSHVLIDSERDLHYNSRYRLGSSLKKGSYFLKINEHGKSTVRRIIKN